MSKKLNFLETHAGFSLIEVLVSIGLMSLLSLGMMSMIAEQSKNVKSVDEKLTIQSTQMLVSNILSSSEFCKCFIGSNTFNYSTLTWNGFPTAIGSAYDITCNSVGNPILSLGAKIGNTNLVPTSISLQNVTETTPSTGIFTANLILQFDQNQLMMSRKPISIPFYFNLRMSDPINNRAINLCGTFAGASTIWKQNLDNTIYYNSGAVGIGVVSPLDKLHIDPPLAGGGITIGTNGGAGGFTTLSMGVSAPTGGHSFIQSVRSSGSEWGDIILNPNYDSSSATGGKIGIGTNNPWGVLQIQNNRLTGSGVPGLWISGQGNFPYWANALYFSENSSYSPSKVWAWGAREDFFNLSSEGTGFNAVRMVVKHDTGDVGIGMTNPSTKLDVAGGIRPGNETQISTCDATTEGTLRYNRASHQMEFCNGTSWASLSSGGAVLRQYSGWVHSGATITCPAGYLIEICIMETITGDGQSMLYRQQFNYTPAINSTTCTSINADGADWGRILAICRRN